MTPQKDGKPQRAVLVSILPSESALRICIDDVARSAGNPRGWVQKEHVTNMEYSQDRLREMNFSDKELADFGHYVLARLSAFMDLGES